MSKRILIILGHPAKDSFCKALAKQYAEGAKSAGHQVQSLHLGDLAFDPILREGYASRQPLEPDLLAAQDAIRWAEHLVFIYPLWWGAMPALLKGFFDRLFLPGFAFKYRPNALMVDGLLKGRTAQLLVTMDTPPWYYRWVYCMPGHRQMKATILQFCGIKSVVISSFGPIKDSTQKQRQAWLGKVLALGLKA